MPDFNQEKPPIAITNPGGVISTEYPRHVHKVGAYLEVKTDAEKAAALADGWSLLPVAEDATAKDAKSKDAKPKEVKAKDAKSKEGA